MDSHNQPPTMSQKIFQLGFSVKTVSVYLLCCGIADAGAPVTTKNLTAKWNSSKKTLSRGLQELMEKNILSQILSDGEGNEAYKILDEKSWKK